ncbi:geranylgeranylglycerol-phosphate geranylgeranyltransferase [Candidatus Bathyarchaeota archaeon]|nr:geranylgeranylglycerol-phosphate geranylgeranyltransferase [Candidatus Bathyarchaeota archaeon]
MGRFTVFVRLLRPINCAMIGFAVIVGAALADSGSLIASWTSLTYGFLAGFTLTAASMAINDYYDREIDAVNEPSRPIPSGQIKPHEALAVAAIFSIIGMVSAYLNNFYCFLVAAVSWAVSMTYTTVGKRSGLGGNFLVSLCVAIPFIYGSLAVSSVIKPKVLVFAGIVFLSYTGREITKGIVDVQGDGTRGVKTVAVHYGEKNAAFASAFFYVLGVLLSPIPWLFGMVSFWFVPVVALTDVGLVVSSLMLLKDYSRDNARRVKTMVLFWFLTGLLAFILGAF